MADYELDISTSAIPSISANALSIGVPIGSVSIIPAISISHTQGIVIHQSAFDVNVDYDLDAAELSIMPIIIGNPVAVGISSEASLSVIPSIQMDAFPCMIIHHSVFDVCAPVIVEGDVTVIPSAISCNLVNGVYGSISVIPSVAESILGVGITALPASVLVIPAIEADIIKEAGIKFGTLKFLYAKRNSTDVITPIIDDRFVNTGTHIPRAYTRKISVIAATDNVIVYSEWMNLINQVRTLFVDGTPYDKAILTAISDRKIKPGLDRWEWTMEFIHHVYAQRDTVLIDGYAISNVVAIGDEQKQPILDDRFTRSGITEPVAFNVTRSIEFVDTSSNIHQTLENKIGRAISVTINGTTKTCYKITDISTYQAQGGGNISVISVSLQRYQFNKSDSVIISGVGTLPNVLTVSDEKKSPILTDVFTQKGISEPAAFNVTRSIEFIDDSREWPAKLESVIGSSLTVNINGDRKTKYKIAGINTSSPKGSGNPFVISIDLQRYQFDKTDSVNLDTVTIPNIVAIGDENKQPILDDRFTRSGITEPVAFSLTRNIDFIDGSGNYTGILENRIGKSIAVIINGESETGWKITGINRKQSIGGDISIHSVSLTRYQFNTTDTVKFNGLNLSNPILPNAMDITPTYSVDMSVNNTITNGIPKITRRYAFECIATSTSEFDTLVSWIGIRGTLVINGKSHTLCHITTLSALQPIGGGDVWKYTIEFSRDSGISPAVVTFDGISLPNAVISSESLELLQSRATLHSGKIAVNIGVYPSKQVTISCMSNSKSVYNSLYAKLGQKKTLVVDGETITKAYISELQSARVIGEGRLRLYTWDISFEQETA